MSETKVSEVNTAQGKKTRSQIKREAIIDAALFAYKEYGVQATSMDKLAEIAQVSKRTVYNHFESKEALVMCLIGELWQRAMVQPHINYQAKIELKEQLVALLIAEVDLLSNEEYIDLARVACGYMFYNQEALQCEMARFAEQDTATTRWLKAATQDNKLKINDIELATKQLHNLIKGSAFWPQLFQMEPRLTKKQGQALANNTADMFLSFYKA